MNILNEFKKIDLPWVLEVITERFDFLPIDAMTHLSIVYGGAIRDALAGIPLRGDLDIVVPQKHLLAVVNIIGKSSRWSRIRSGGLSIRAIKPPSYRKRKKNVMPPGIGKHIDQNHVYGEHVPIDKLIRFVNQHGVEIELIVAKSGAGDTEACVIDVPKRVDIVCCGLAMDKCGDIFEIVDGAYDQCKERVLRFNEAVAGIVDIPRMEMRIEKLVKRGYTSEIDIEAVKKNQKKFAKNKPKSKPKKKEDLWGDILGERMEYGTYTGQERPTKELMHAKMYGAAAPANAGRIRGKTRRNKKVSQAYSTTYGVIDEQHDSLEERCNRLKARREELINMRGEVIEASEELDPASMNAKSMAGQRAYLKAAISSIDSEIEAIVPNVKPMPLRTSLRANWSTNSSAPPIEAVRHIVRNDNEPVSAENAAQQAQTVATEGDDSFECVSDDVCNMEYVQGYAYDFKLGSYLGDYGEEASSDDESPKDFMVEIDKVVCKRKKKGYDNF